MIFKLNLIFFLYFFNIYTSRGIIFLRLVLIFFFSFLNSRLFLEGIFQCVNFFILIIFFRRCFDYFFVVNNFIFYYNIWNINIFFFNFVRDPFSLLMVGLTIFIIFCCIVFELREQFYSYFWILSLLRLEILLLLSFSTNNFFVFYIFFEFIICPTFFLIIFFGSRGRRVHAALYFFYYTFISSIRIIFSLFLITFWEETIRLFLNSNSFNILWSMFFWRGFATKIPIYPFHLWLPEAHVEAPTVGSVILAALLLKLGGYALIRVSCCLDFFILENIRVYLIPFCLRSVIFASIRACRQIDLKRVIAYSSIVHMNLSRLALLSNNIFGRLGCILSRVSHALISSALFFCAGRFYLRLHTRNLVYYGGLFDSRKRLSFFFLFFIFCNIGFPPFCGFISEFLIFLGIYGLGYKLFLFARSSFILVAIFCISLGCRVLYGYYFKYNLVVEVNIIEFFILFLLSFFIIRLGFFPGFVLIFCVFI